mmetsp:Transcript_31856/g.77626  ORF Transcript_31856/g.77626 Transcript_31856/m.77626 type:complete len:207 (+) Transcript_31856:2107-2727(+)
MASIREGKWLMPNPCILISSGTGRTSGWKLYKLLEVAPIQFPRSFALATDVPRATTRILLPVCAAMYLIRETITSRIGPTVPPMRWISSTMKRLTVCTSFLVFHRRDKISQFFGEEITICPLFSVLKSSCSPVNFTTFSPSFPNFNFQSLYLSSTSESRGAMYTHLPLMFFFPLANWDSIRKIASSAQTVFPEPVGAQTRTLLSPL